MIHINSQEKNVCPCGSGKDFSRCCKAYAILLPKYETGYETVLISWMDRYSGSIQTTFRRKAGRFIFLISIYVDYIFDFLCPLGFKSFSENQEIIDKSVKAIKHNIILSLIASLSCLAQGLFLQSGSLIRNCIEDALVLLDIFENDEQVKIFLLGNYSANNVLKRVKQFIPNEFKLWYGHFSANFTHFGPFHSAPYMPRACYADTVLLGAGLENILLGAYLFHVILERAHFRQLSSSLFWINRNDYLVFSKDNDVTKYVHNLQNEMYAKFPPRENKKGYKYDQRIYRFK
jgi:hypothetical protein